jgi:flagellar motor protein MotB
MSGTRLTEEPESEGYFASVSDLMVGILFVFLLMLTVFALNFRDDSASLDSLRAELQVRRAEAQAASAAAEAARAEAEQQLARAEQLAIRARAREEEAARLRAQNEVLRAKLQEAAEKLELELAGREEARKALLHRLARGLEARQIQFILDAGSGVLRLSDAVPFEPNSSALTVVTRRTVTALGEVLAEVLPCFARGAPRQNCDPSDSPILEAMLVEGHTDRQPFGNMTAAESQARNDALSTERALTVFAHLRQQQRILDDLRNPSDQPLLGVSGYGQRRPLPEATSVSQAHFAQNRRIDLRFILSARTSDEIRRLLEDIAALQRSDVQ